MIPTALSRNEGPVPALDETAASECTPAADAGPAKATTTPAAENEQAAEKGQTAENGLTPHGGHATLNGAHTKREKRMKRTGPSSRIGNTAEKATDEARPALAVFCFEGPETAIGQTVANTVDALARRKTRVHLFTRQPFGLDLPDLLAHPVGDCPGADYFAQVEEFTRRAANAFLSLYPGGSPQVTLIGYEWSGAGPLGLLRGIKNNRTIFSVASLERQRSDMTSPVSKRIDELERTILREAQVVLSQQPAASDTARFWAPECASRLVAARHPFPVASFESKLDPGQVKARYQIGPVDPTILYVGDISDRYGPDLLVKAMPAILKNNKQARLILVGDGPTYWTLRVYSRYLLLDHAIRFPGSVVGQPMSELVAAADIIAVPSRESTPWWPIQAAWAAGRPVVATHQAAPGLLEHERDSLLVYPVEQSVVWGVERLLYDEKLGATLGQKGRQKLEERFGWNHVAEQIEELMGVAVKG
jgi:glycosyltransferase involved in cell wall biosynthesis